MFMGYFSQKRKCVLGGIGYLRACHDKKAPTPEHILLRMLHVAEHGDILPAAKEQVGDHYYLLNQRRMAFAREVAETLDVRGPHGGREVQEAVGGTPGVKEEAAAVRSCSRLIASHERDPSWKLPSGPLGTKG